MARKPRLQEDVMARKYARREEIEEFNDIVDQINEELQQLQDADPDAISLERWRGYFHKEDPNADLDYRTFKAMYRQAKNLLESGQLSLEGHERSVSSTIETLRNDLGLDYINRRNFNSFMRFLDDARARGLGSVYSSEQLLDAINKAKKKGLTKAQIRANMDRWAKKVVRLDKEGKQVEIISPPEIKVRKITLRDKKGR